MKAQFFTLLTTLALATACTAADLIEVKDLGQKNLQSGTTSFVKADKIPDSGYYAGYRIDLKKKEDGRIHGRVSIISMDGFIELENGKSAPITQFKEVTFIISKAGAWTHIPIGKNDLPIALRWTE